MKLARV